MAAKAPMGRAARPSASGSSALPRSVSHNVAVDDRINIPAIESPLTQQSRPEYFEPKIISSYRRLFRDVDVDDDDKSEGFWTELFLLRPELNHLRQMLEDTDPDFLLHVQHNPQQLVQHGIAHITSARSPAAENALDTLTVFFAVVLSKKYTNPSADLIEVLAGLDRVDTVFNDLVAVLDHTIRDGDNIALRQKAVKTAIAVVAGGYQTALVSYFINRDLFPGLMKLVHQLDHPLQAAEPLLLAGLLANYNKFEVHNQYRVRFSDFVNNETMGQVIQSVAWTCTLLRQRYIVIQDDTPVGWSLSSPLSYVGLGSLVGAKPAVPVLTEEQQRVLFAEQPGIEAASLLTLYDFSLANKMFCHQFITYPALDKQHAPPFSIFLSFAAYLYHHAYRSERSSLYAGLTQFILLILVEEPTLAKSLCETSATVRLCRQRLPNLPLVKEDRSYTAAIIDLLIDGVNHNLRKRLDTRFYTQSILVLTKLLTYLAKSRTKLAYHWSELWRSLLAFVRFLTTYATDLNLLSGTSELVEKVASVLALALTSGEAFLPDDKAYDDLIYKLVEFGESLEKFRDAYHLAKTDDAQAMATLIGVSKHYQELIDDRRNKGTFLSPREVTKIIKQGYETLSIEANETVEQQSRFQEVDHKSELKRIARVAVADAAAGVAGPETR